MKKSKKINKNNSSFITKIYFRRSFPVLKRFLDYNKYFLVIIIFGILYYFSCFSTLANLLFNNIDSLTKKINFKLETVYLEGQIHTNKKQILNVAKVKIGQSIFSLSLPEIKHDLEKIEWVKYAVLERHFPNNLYISIIERKPIAIWQNLGKFYLVDDEGMIISNYDIKNFSHLIILTGDDAPLYSKSLLSIITKDKDLFKEVSSAIRIGERRWNVRFNNGLEIKFPEEDMEKYWDYIIKLYKEKYLFAKGVNTIDLRIPNKLYIN